MSRMSSGSELCQSVQGIRNLLTVFSVEIGLPPRMLFANQSVQLTTRGYEYRNHIQMVIAEMILLEVMKRVPDLVCLSTISSAIKRSEKSTART